MAKIKPITPEMIGAGSSARIAKKMGLTTGQFGNMRDDLRTTAESDVRRMLNSLEAEDRKLVIQILDDLVTSGDPDLSLAYKSIWEIDYKWQPVSMEQFLDDDTYLGKFTDTLFPKWREVLCDVFAPGSTYSELLLGGSIGAGKTFSASVAMTRVIYQLSCLKNPQRYYGLSEGSKIVFGFYSITKQQAGDVGYDKMRTFIEDSPYFQEKYDFNRRLLHSIAFKESNVLVKIGSREMHALGSDLFGLAMDEVNFMQNVSVRARKMDPAAKGQAEKLYNATRARLASRFMRPGGNIPGLLILISSKQDENAFLERRKRESVPDQQAKKVKVCEYSVWEVRDAKNYTLPKFWVEVGDRMYASRVLDATDEVAAREEARPAADVVCVPGEYRSQFNGDVEQALRDLAGIATYGLTPLMRDGHKIAACANATWRHPFTRDEVTLSGEDDVQLDSYFKPAEMFVVSRSQYVPRYDPQMPRFIHIDIGLTNDSLGIACAHAHGIREVRRYREVDNTYYLDPVPVVHVDFVLRIRPPKRGEIELSKIRTFIMSLRDMGLPIHTVSFDGYQSADSKQILLRAGVNARVLSLDRTDEPYMALKQGIIESRVVYYPHAYFMKELRALERDLSAGKVDHPMMFDDNTPGSKDCSDAVCGACYQVLTMPEAYKNARVNIMDDSQPRPLDLASTTHTAYGHVGQNIDWERAGQLVNRTKRK